MKNLEKGNPVIDLISDALSNIKTLIDMDTMVGDAIDMGVGVKAYPIIKITVGIVSGGGEYSNKIMARKKQVNYPFIGGTGTGFSAEPIGFLIVDKMGHKLITMQNKTAWAGVINKVGDGLADYLKSLSQKINIKNKEKKD